MARPIKNNADYFPHDADMRNDPRIKAMRRKFGLEGYAIYSMLLEFITDSDFFEFKKDPLTIELIAGDFDCDPEKLQLILEYCFQLDLFQIDEKTQVISCKSLDKRLEPLLSKRKRDRNVVIADDNTQSKVKESKVKESKVKESKVVPLRAEIIPFGTDDFLNAWSEWEQHRKEIKKKLTPSTAKKQLKFLGSKPVNVAIDIINQSITNGWAGLFEMKVQQANGFISKQEVPRVYTPGKRLGDD